VVQWKKDGCRKCAIVHFESARPCRQQFVESGFAGSTIEVTVTSDDGKRVEKVSIAKSGSRYIAKRANEPTLYQLESSSVDALQKAADDIKPAATSGK